MRLLPFQVGMGNQRAGLTQSKAPLPEQTLALTHPQVDLEALLDPGAQRFPIPQRTRQAQVARSLTQNSIHFQQLGLAQTPGAPERGPSVNPARPWASKRRTQFSTVRGASPSKRLTSGQVAPCATNNTPWSRWSYRDSSERRISSCSPKIIVSASAI